MPELPAQLPNESKEAYTRFIAWIKAEYPRPSYSDFAKKTGYKYNTLIKYSSLYNWQDRAIEYDKARTKDKASITYEELRQWHVEDLKEARTVLRSVVRQIGRALVDKQCSPATLASIGRTLDGIVTRHGDFLYPAGAPEEDFGLPEDDTAVAAFDRLLGRVAAGAVEGAVVADDDDEAHMGVERAS